MEHGVETERYCCEQDSGGSYSSLLWWLWLWAVLVCYSASSSLKKKEWVLCKPLSSPSWNLGKPTLPVSSWCQVQPQCCELLCRTQPLIGNWQMGEQHGRRNGFTLTDHFDPWDFGLSGNFGVYNFSIRKGILNYGGDLAP